MDEWHNWLSVAFGFNAAVSVCVFVGEKQSNQLKSKIVCGKTMTSKCLMYNLFTLRITLVRTNVCRTFIIERERERERKELIVDKISCTCLSAHIIQYINNSR